MVKKLFFVINSLEGGGAERTLSVVANSLSQKQNIDVSIICLNKASPAYEINPKIKIISLINGRNSENILNRIKYVGLIYFKLVSLLLKEKPYYVISFMTTANLWTGLACGLIKVKFIVSERTTPDRTINSYSYLLRKLSFLVYQNSRAIVVPAQGIADRIKKHSSFKNLNNFKLIRNPLNPFPLPSKKSVNDKKFILAVGRLNYVKGFDILIDAFSKIQKQDIDLIILGEGNEFHNLKNQIDNLNLLNRVKLLGFKSNLQDYYSQAKLFVLASRNEGYPGALIEAMSFGCPCIAVNCEFGPSEIIKHGENGILVEQHNQTQLISAMNILLKDNQLRKKIAIKAQDIKQTNSLESISNNWNNLILNTY
jgi:glycosyltransferase involved in cell wall biosynthesis